MAKVSRKRKFDFSKWESVLDVDGYLKPPPRTHKMRTPIRPFKQGDVVVRVMADYQAIKAGHKYTILDWHNGFIRLEEHPAVWCVPKHFKKLETAR